MNEKTWTFEELEAAQRFMGRGIFQPQEIDEMFNLYNRINGTTKRPTGCGKCVINVLKNLQNRYEGLTRQRG